MQSKKKNEKRKLAESTFTEGENAQSFQQSKKKADQTTSNSETSRALQSAPVGDGHRMEQRKDVKALLEPNPVHSIEKRFLGLSWVHNELERVDCLEGYEQLASYVWRATEDGLLLVVPGTPPALGEWDGCQVDDKAERPITTEQQLDRVMCPESPIEPVLRALTVCLSN